MIDMLAPPPGLYASAPMKVEIVAPQLIAVRGALKKTFAPFLIIPDIWGELLDRLD